MAPTLTGNNFLTAAEDSIIESLAVLPATQAWLGVVDSTAAKARIYVHTLPRTVEDSDGWTEAEWAAMFPLIILGPPTEGELFAIRHSATGTEWESVCDISYSLRFERRLPAGDIDEQNEIRRLMNDVCNVIEDMVNANGQGGTFSYSSITPSGSPYRGGYGRIERMETIQGWKIEIANTISGDS